MAIADIANGETVASVTTKLNAVIGIVNDLTTAQTELTDELATITFTAPTSADYALQDLTDTGGFGFKTKDEGNSVLAVIANLQTRTKELEDKLVALGFLADAD